MAQCKYELVLYDGPLEKLTIIVLLVGANTVIVVTSVLHRFYARWLPHWTGGSSLATISIHKTNIFSVHVRWSDEVKIVTSLSLFSTFCSQSCGSDGERHIEEVLEFQCLLEWYCRTCSRLKTSKIQVRTLLVLTKKYILMNVLNKFRAMQSQHKVRGLTPMLGVIRHVHWSEIWPSPNRTLDHFGSDRSSNYFGSFSVCCEKFENPSEIRIQLIVKKQKNRNSLGSSCPKIWIDLFENWHQFVLINIKQFGWSKSLNYDNS